jgi:uncharacterized phage infection (PIP) family protein YhgE
MYFCSEQALVEFGRRRARTVDELRAERAQLEMQLVVGRVATAGAVASEASSRVTLEASRQSAEDRTTVAQAAAATATTERESLEARLAQEEAKIEDLRSAMKTANDAAEKATAAAAETAAQNGTQEKATFETKVAELE